MFFRVSCIEGSAALSGNQPDVKSKAEPVRLAQTASAVAVASSLLTAVAKSGTKQVSVVAISDDKSEQENRKTQSEQKKLALRTLKETDFVTSIYNLDRLQLDSLGRYYLPGNVPLSFFMSNLRRSFSFWKEDNVFDQKKLTLIDRSIKNCWYNIFNHPEIFYFFESEINRNSSAVLTDKAARALCKPLIDHYKTLEKEYPLKIASLEVLHERILHHGFKNFHVCFVGLGIDRFDKLAEATLLPSAVMMEIDILFSEIEGKTRELVEKLGEPSIDLYKTKKAWFVEIVLQDYPEEIEILKLKGLL